MAAPYKTLHVDDSLTIFEVQVVDGETELAVPIVSPTTLEIRFKKPSGSTVVKTAVLSSNGSDGKLRYIAEVGFLDQPGHWKLQGFVVMTAWSGYTGIGEFEVEENL